jgi:capsular polysaccharide biosynthesis protein
MSQRYGRMLLVMIPVGMVLGLILSRVHLYLVPCVYESEVIFQIKYNPPSEDTMESAVTTNHIMRSICFPTEFEPFKSRTILSKVSQHLKLESSWNVDEDTVVARLRDAVQVMKIRETDLKRVKVTSTDPVEARDIARELIHTYREWRTELEKEAKDRTLVTMRQAVQEQEEEVEKARKELDSTAKNKDGEKLYYEYDVATAKRHFDQESDTFEQMKLKLVGVAIVGATIEDRVVIHEKPEIPNNPIGLSERLIMLNWMVGGALLAPLFALPIMSFLNRRRRLEMG